MTVNTKKVTDRRELRFESLDDVVQEAENLASLEIEQLGNWSLGQILVHLAAAMNCSIDGFPFKAPLPIRLIAPLLFKKKFIYKAVPAGFQVPKGADDFSPGNTSNDEGLEAIKQAVARLGSETKRSPNPGLGELTTDEWNNFHCRHAEMHLSFLKAK